MGRIRTLHHPEGHLGPGRGNVCYRQKATKPPSSQPTNNLFAQSLGRPSREQVPPQNAALTRQALEEWERTICENKAVAILERLQEGRPAIFQQDGGAMLIPMVLDRPLTDAQFFFRPAPLWLSPGRRTLLC